MTVVDVRADLANATLVAIQELRRICNDKLPKEGDAVRVKAASALLGAWTKVTEAEELGRNPPPSALPRPERIAQLKAALHGPDDELTEAIRGEVAALVAVDPEAFREAVEKVGGGKRG